MNTIERALRGDPDAGFPQPPSRPATGGGLGRTAVTFGIIGTAFGPAALAVAIVALAAR